MHRLLYAGDVIDSHIKKKKQDFFLLSISQYHAIEYFHTLYLYLISFCVYFNLIT